MLYFSCIYAHGVIVDTPLTLHHPIVSAVCFFVFDQDKAGYFEEEELKSLMNALHKVKPGETVKGNVKAA